MDANSDNLFVLHILLLQFWQLCNEYKWMVVTLPLMARPNTGLNGFKLHINDSQAAALRSSKDSRPLSINASS